MLRKILPMHECHRRQTTDRQQMELLCHNANVTSHNWFINMAALSWITIHAHSFNRQSRHNVRLKTENALTLIYAIDPMNVEYISQCIDRIRVIHAVTISCCCVRLQLPLNSCVVHLGIHRRRDELLTQYT